MKDLDSLKLTRDEINILWKKYSGSRRLFDEVAQAQIDKIKDKQGEALEDYRNDKISFERLAERMNLNLYALAPIKENLPTSEEIRIRIIDYVMADGDTDKFIEWLERKLLV